MTPTCVERASRMFQGAGTSLQPANSRVNYVQATDAQIAMWSDVCTEAALCAGLLEWNTDLRTKLLQSTYQTTLRPVHQSPAYTRP